MRLQDPRLEDSYISHFEKMAMKQVGNSRLMQEKQISRLGKYQVGFGVRVGPFYFFQGNDTRHWIVSRTIIQPVCLYPSVLFLDLFSLCVNCVN